MPARSLRWLVTVVHHRFRCGAYSCCRKDAAFLRPPLRGSRVTGGLSSRGGPLRARTCNVRSTMGRHGSRSITRNAGLGGTTRPHRASPHRTNHHARTSARTKLVLEFWTARRELRENRKRLLTRISDAAGGLSVFAFVSHLRATVASLPGHHPACAHRQQSAGRRHPCRHRLLVDWAPWGGQRSGG
jgi:hypothetical protein